MRSSGYLVHHGPYGPPVLRATASELFLIALRYWRLISLSPATSSMTRLLWQLLSGICPTHARPSASSCDARTRQPSRHTPTRSSGLPLSVVRPHFTGMRCSVWRPLSSCPPLRSTSMTSTARFTSPLWLPLIGQGLWMVYIWMTAYCSFTWHAPCPCPMHPSASPSDASPLLPLATIALC